MKPNASVFDSAIYADIFSSQPMREVWSDETRIQRYLDFERALAKVQADLEIIPKAAADSLVVLQKLFKDRAFLSMSSRYAATPKN